LAQQVSTGKERWKMSMLLHSNKSLNAQLLEKSKRLVDLKRLIKTSDDLLTAEILRLTQGNQRLCAENGRL
jgi:hypothetical protein